MWVDRMVEDEALFVAVVCETTGTHECLHRFTVHQMYGTHTYTHTHTQYTYCLHCLLLLHLGPLAPPHGAEQSQCLTADGRGYCWLGTETKQCEKATCTRIHV